MVIEIVISIGSTYVEMKLVGAWNQYRHPTNVVWSRLDDSICSTTLNKYRYLNLILKREENILPVVRLLGKCSLLGDISYHTTPKQLYEETSKKARWQNIQHSVERVSMRMFPLDSKKTVILLWSASPHWLVATISYYSSNIIAL